MEVGTKQPHSMMPTCQFIRLSCMKCMNAQDTTEVNIKEQLIGTFPDRTKRDDEEEAESSDSCETPSKPCLGKIFINTIFNLVKVR
jgi:hypothetical protein